MKAIAATLLYSTLLYSTLLTGCLAAAAATAAALIPALGYMIPSWLAARWRVVLARKKLAAMRCKSTQSVRHYSVYLLTYTHTHTDIYTNNEETTTAQRCCRTEIKKVNDAEYTHQQTSIHARFTHTHARTDRRSALATPCRPVTRVAVRRNRGHDPQHEVYSRKPHRQLPLSSHRINGTPFPSLSLSLFLSHCANEKNA